MLTPVTVPELGSAGHVLRISAWFAEVGDPIAEGDRLFEVLISGITSDVAAECAGRLARIEKDLDAVVAPGDTVAWIEH
jgi:pyruvate/2-oxoglutarate dehydrogenase complex dihydrolipoamide acyltransferase (E2) component